MQAKANRELTNLGATLTSTNVHKGYLMCSKSKVNPMVQDTEENNVLQQEPCDNDNADALNGATTILNLLSPPTDNSNSQQFNNSHMKCYCDCTHGCFLDYFNDPILDDAVTYTGDIPFHYNKAYSRNTDFVGNLAGTVFIVVKRDLKILLNQSNNTANMSRDSLNFGTFWNILKGLDRQYVVM